MATRQRNLKSLTLLLALALAGCSAPENGATQKALIAGRLFTLELALTPPQRTQGLSDRHDIAPDGGMLFVFPDVLSGNEDSAFWMRHCYVPIDLLYLDADGRIVATHQMQVEPYDRPESQLKLYPAGWPYQFVVELRSGLIGQFHLGKGAKVELRAGTWESLKQRSR
jgi:uncharacterized membrane protein (UPF0127 family)